LSKNALSNLFRSLLRLRQCSMHVIFGLQMPIHSSQDVGLRQKLKEAELSVYTGPAECRSQSVDH
ncbi:hypothetical protein HAX54_037983, partial [Datura stramonium]|nr:hypothetical protein [Datura stramonium]